MIAWPWRQNKTASVGEMFHECLAQADQHIRATKSYIYSPLRALAGSEKGATRI
jgi:hypothetical protein